VFDYKRVFLRRLCGMRFNFSNIHEHATTFMISDHHEVFIYTSALNFVKGAGLLRTNTTAEAIQCIRLYSERFGIPPLNRPYNLPSMTLLIDEAISNLKNTHSFRLIEYSHLICEFPRITDNIQILLASSILKITNKTSCGYVKPWHIVGMLIVSSGRILNRPSFFYVYDTNVRLSVFGKIERMDYLATMILECCEYYERQILGIDIEEQVIARVSRKRDCPEWTHALMGVKTLTAIDIVEPFHSEDRVNHGGYMETGVFRHGIPFYRPEKNPVVESSDDQEELFECPHDSAGPSNENSSIPPSIDTPSTSRLTLSIGTQPLTSPSPPKTSDERSESTRVLTTDCEQIRMLQSSPAQVTDSDQTEFSTPPASPIGEAMTSAGDGMHKLGQSLWRMKFRLMISDMLNDYSTYKFMVYDDVVKKHPRICEPDVHLTQDQLRIVKNEFRIHKNHVQTSKIEGIFLCGEKNRNTLGPDDFCFLATNLLSQKEGLLLSRDSGSYAAIKKSVNTLIDHIMCSPQQSVISMRIIPISHPIERVKMIAGLREKGKLSDVTRLALANEADNTSSDSDASKGKRVRDKSQKSCGRGSKRIKT